MKAASSSNGSSNDLIAQIASLSTECGDLDAKNLSLNLDVCQIL